MDRAWTRVERHTQIWPVYLAWPVAMNAADSSWRACTKSMPPSRGNAPTRPLIDALIGVAEDLTHTHLPGATDDGVGDCAC